MTVYSYSGKGNRITNEDYIKSEEFDNNASLHIVADGMGGYLYGEIASRVATEAIVQYISERHSDTTISSTIQQAILFANEQIALIRSELQAKLGTTIAGVFIRENVAHAFWLGDVQILHFRENKLLFESESHLLINDMKKNGVISDKEIERYKNIVTNSLSGNSLDLNIPVIQINLKPGDIVCISSDGLYNSINPQCLLFKSDIEVDINLNDIEKCNQDNLSIIKLTY